MATDRLDIDIILRDKQAQKALERLGAQANKVEKSLSKMGSGRTMKPLGEGLSAATVNANEFEKSMAAANARVIAFGASAGVIFQVTRALRETVKATIEVEKALADINVVLNTDTASLKKFGGELFKIAGQTGQSFQVVAAGATELARQGLAVSETLKRTNDALILTRLTGMGAEEAVSALTAAVNSFSQAGITSTQVINKMAKVDQAFAVSSDDLSKAISRVGSSALDAGVNMDQLFGIVTALQQRTARGGAVIGNALKTIFTRIQRTDVQKKLQRIGVTTQDMNGNMLGAVQVLTQLAGKFRGLSDAQKAQISESVAGVFQINQLKALLGDLSDQYGITTRATRMSATATNEAIIKNEQLNKTLAAQINKTKETLRGVGAVLGEDIFGPTINNVLTIVNDAVGAFQEGGRFEEFGQTVGKSLLKGLGAVLAGPGLAIVTFALGKLTFSLGKFAVTAGKSFFGINSATASTAANLASVTNQLMSQPALVERFRVAQVSSGAAAQQVLASINAQGLALQRNTAYAQQMAASMLGGMGGGRGSIRRAHGGSVPNFSPLGDALARERKAGVPNYAIRVGADPSLASKSNPSGVGVYNTIDEPRGIGQGIQRYRSKGLDPRSAGIPNFAKSGFTIAEHLLPDDLARLETRRALVSMPPGTAGGMSIAARRRGFNRGMGRSGGMSDEMRTFKKGSEALIHSSKHLTDSSKDLSRGFGGFGGMGKTALMGGAMTLPMIAAMGGASNSGIQAAMIGSMAMQGMGFLSNFGGKGAPIAGPARAVQAFSSPIGPMRPKAMMGPGGLGSRMVPQMLTGELLPPPKEGMKARLSRGLGTALRNKVGKPGGGISVGRAAGSLARGSGYLAIAVLAIEGIAASFAESDLEKSAKELEELSKKDFRPALANLDSMVSSFSNNFSQLSIAARKSQFQQISDQVFGEDLMGKASTEQFNELTSSYKDFVNSLTKGPNAIREAGDKLLDTSAKLTKQLGELDKATEKYNATVARQTLLNFLADNKTSGFTDSILASLGDLVGLKFTGVGGLVDAERTGFGANSEKFTGVSKQGERAIEMALGMVQLDNAEASIKSDFEKRKGKAGMNLIGLGRPTQATMDQFSDDPTAAFEGVKKPVDVARSLRKDLESLVRSPEVFKGADENFYQNKLMGPGDSMLERLVQAGMNRADAQVAISGIASTAATLDTQAGNLVGGDEKEIEKKFVELAQPLFRQVDNLITKLELEGTGQAAVGRKPSFVTGEELLRQSMIAGRQANMTRRAGERTRMMQPLDERLAEIQQRTADTRGKHMRGIFGDAEMKRIESIRQATETYNNENDVLNNQIKEEKEAQRERLEAIKAGAVAQRGFTDPKEAEEFMKKAFGSEEMKKAMGNESARRNLMTSLQARLNVARAGNAGVFTTDTEKQVAEAQLKLLRAIQDGSVKLEDFNQKQANLTEAREKQEKIAQAVFESDVEVIKSNYRYARQREEDVKLLKAGMSKSRAAFAKQDLEAGKITGSQFQSLRAQARSDARDARGLTGDGAFAGFGAITRDALTYGPRSAVEEFESGIADVAISVRDSMKDAIKNIASGAESFEDGMFRIFAALADKIADQGISMGVNSLFGMFGGKRHGGKIARGYNRGGVVMGGSGVRDDVPAMMQGGEYVIKKSSAQKIGYGALNAINSYANGGKARVSLAKEFLFTGDDPKRPTGGRYNVSRNLSTSALFRDDDPQTDRMFGRQDKLVNYLEYRRTEQARRDKVLDDIKRQKRARLMNAYMSAGLRIGAGFIGQNFGPQAGGTASVEGGTGSGALTINPSKAGSNVPEFPMARGGSPALLMGGEYVMSSRTVNKYGTGFMAQLNSGRMPGYNQGGLVGGGGATAGVTTNNVNLAINIDKTGNAQVETQEQDSNTNGQGSESQEVESSKKFADAIRAAVQKEITKQQRPGGLLRDGASYAGGRRI